MNKTRYKKGSYNVVCDRCGFYFKAEDLKKTYDGFMVCAKDWEPRHELDFLKVDDKDRALPYTRPDAVDTFVSVTYGSMGTQENTIPTGTFNNSL